MRMPFSQFSKALINRNIERRAMRSEKQCITRTDNNYAINSHTKYVYKTVWSRDSFTSIHSECVLEICICRMPKKIIIMHGGWRVNSNYPHQKNAANCTCPIGIHCSTIKLWCVRLHCSTLCGPMRPPFTSVHSNRNSTAGDPVADSNQQQQQILWVARKRSNDKRCVDFDLKLKG